MNFMKKVALVAATTLSLVCAANAVAAPLQYDIKGTGSGSIGSYTFTNQAFDISFIGDAAANPRLIDPLTLAKVTVNGFGTTTLNIATRVGVASNTVVYFSRSESIGGADLFDFFLDTPLYNLDSAFSLTGRNVFALTQFKNVDSTLGPLTFSSSSNVVFSSSAVAAVPEPETYALLLAGLGLVGVVARRKTSKNAA